MSGKIFVTGDTHQNFARFFSTNFPMGEKLDKEDYMIICGDFGLLWDYHGWSKKEKELLDWLNQRPWTTLFCDGNHENYDRLENYPVELWHGGNVHKISNSIIHLMRGEIFEIAGERIFTFGGGKSHDIRDGILDPESSTYKEDYNRLIENPFALFRTKGIGWWEREMPSSKEYQWGRNNLLVHDNEVDYIISHEPDVETLIYFGAGLYESNPLNIYLRDIKMEVNYKKHFCGHIHIDARYNPTKTEVLFENIIRIK